MIWSEFDERTGLYRYFQTPEEWPVNADLPVPDLPADAGKIGVASIHAGRPLPAGAKRVGQGWHARGLVARPRSSGALRGLGDGGAGVPSVLWWGVVLGVGALAGYVYWAGER